MKQVIKNYAFNAAARTITLSDFSGGQPVLLERLALITDTTTNKILYNFADSSLATAAVSSNNVITLSTLQGGEANTDKLRIDYDTVTGDTAYDTPVLASGAATAAKQDTGNTSLGSIDTKLPSNLTVTSTRLLVDGSGVTQPVSGTVTSNIGTTNGLALDATLTGGNLKAQGNVASGASDSGNPVKVGGRYNSSAPTLTDGQRGDLQLDSSGNLKVTSGGTQTVSGTVGATQSGTWTVQPGNTANTTAWKVDASSVAVPVTDNGGSLTVDGTVTANAGTGTFATKETRSTTGTTSSVNDTNSSTTLLSSNASRLGASIFNDSSATLYIKTGTTASTTDYTAKLYTDEYWEAPYGYTGRIDGIWSADSTGAARITEYS